MYIAGAPAVGCESKDAYRWCTPYRMRVLGCISLVCSLLEANPGMYIVGASTVEC